MKKDKEIISAIGISEDDLRSLKKNASGCPDPTAYEAIVNVMMEEINKVRSQEKNN
jgi:hypothetical protein